MRFIDLGTVTPEYSVCVDKVLLSSYSEDTLLLYSRDRPCISVGRFQRVEDTVDLEYIRRNGISLVRRVSGGSNIYSDEGQITYSLIMSKDRLPVSRNDSFAMICGAVVDVLNILGVDGEYKPINDILVNGRKISGGAQARSAYAVLQHGSMILDVDDGVVKASLKDRKKRSYDGLTSIREHLGYVPSRDAIASAFMSGFSKTFGPVTEGRLDDAEIRMIERSVGSLLV